MKRLSYIQDARCLKVNIYGTVTVYHITNSPYCNYNKNKNRVYIIGFPLNTLLQLRHKIFKNKVGSLDILLVIITTQLQLMIQYIRRKLVETTSNNAPNYVRGIQNLHTFFSIKSVNQKSATTGFISSKR